MPLNLLQRRELNPQPHNEALVRRLLSLSLVGLALLGCPKPKPVIPVSVTPEIYSLSVLSTEEKASYQSLLETLPSPCGDPETLQASVEAKRCGRAVFLSRVAFRAYRDKKIEEARLSELMQLWVAKMLQRGDAEVSVDLSKAPTKGSSAAQVEIIEFADFQCPYCAFVHGELQKLWPRLETTTKFYFKNFPLSQHANAEPAARAALAAKQQNKFWEYFDTLFTHQEKIAPDRFLDWAKDLGLDLDQFSADYSSTALSKQVAADRQDGIDAGVDQTPSFFINKRRYFGPLEEDAIWDAVLFALADRGSSPMPEAPK
jgi:protein-disulfide isomerase